MHNNMITINGKKMGKSYNNVIKLTEMFSGNHPLLSQAFHPMVVRFFILQSHYRSPLDFGSEALVASEKAFRRLWESYEQLKKMDVASFKEGSDKELNEKVTKLVNEFEEFIEDDFSTAKVLANMFDLSAIINSIKDGHIKTSAVAASTISLMQKQFKIYLEDIFGLKNMAEAGEGKLSSVMQLLIDIRKEAKLKKDYATSDKVRNQLSEIGIALKDEKDGTVSWNIA
jgi:cysteinyl-tRNA synthetase